MLGLIVAEKIAPSSVWNSGGEPIVIKLFAFFDMNETFAKFLIRLLLVIITEEVITSGAGAGKKVLLMFTFPQHEPLKVNL